MTQEREVLTEPKEVKLRKLGSSSEGVTIPSEILKAKGFNRAPFIFIAQLEKDKDGYYYIVLKKAR